MLEMASCSELVPNVSTETMAKVLNSPYCDILLDFVYIFLKKVFGGCANLVMLFIKRFVGVYTFL